MDNAATETVSLNSKHGERSLYIASCLVRQALFLLRLRQAVALHQHVAADLSQRKKQSPLSLQ